MQSANAKQQGLHLIVEKAGFGTKIDMTKTIL